MGKDSKLGIEGYWIVLAFLLILIFFAVKEADALELEAGPALLSGEYSDGGVLLISERIGKWSIGGGYISEQYCHCNYPDDLSTNIFFHGQRVIEYRMLEIGIGAAYFQNTNRALGKNLTWSLSLGFGGKHWSIRLRHFSSAGSGTPNLGQDMATIGYSF
jgi:hypothetical protein